MFFFPQSLREGRLESAAIVKNCKEMGRKPRAVAQRTVKKMIFGEKKEDL